jgi:hypothetical protein
MKQTKFMDDDTLPMPSTTRSVNNRAMVYQGTRHSVSEWHILRAAHPNLLITGVPDAVEQSLEALTPHLVPSVWYWPLGASWLSPGGAHLKVFSIEQPPSGARFKVGCVPHAGLEWHP